MKKMYASALCFAAVFFLLTPSQEARAGGVDVHVGIGLPFPGVVVAPLAPPVVYPAPPVVVVPPPRVYQRPVVYPHYRYYGPHHYDRHHWKHKGHKGHGRHHR